MHNLNLGRYLETSYNSAESSKETQDLSTSGDGTWNPATEGIRRTESSKMTQHWIVSGHYRQILQIKRASLNKTVPGPQEGSS